jgi:ABC-type nitrate/sulfonate/bicarbonate transport system substrate-binding protein
LLWRGLRWIDDIESGSEVAATNGAAVVFIFRQEDVDQKPYVVDAFINAVKEAEAFIQNPANFDETVTIAHSYFTFDRPNSEAHGGDEKSRCRATRRRSAGQRQRRTRIICKR